MYGYTMHVPATPEAYQALHAAVNEVVGEQGGGDGLILHVAHATDLGFDITEVWESREQLEAFNRTVFPQAMARAGITMDGPPPPTVEFEPLAVVTPRAFTSDARV
jgi:hypothetical protein